MAGRSNRWRLPSWRVRISSAVALVLVIAATVTGIQSTAQATSPAEVTTNSDDNLVLGAWTPMGALQGGDPSIAFQGPGLNQAVYALTEYQGDIYAGGLFDDTGGGGNNEANCSDDAEYPLQCIAKWTPGPATNPWLPIGGDPDNGLNNQVDAFLVKDGVLYVGGTFDGTVDGPGVGRCKVSPGVNWTAQTAASDDTWSAVTWGSPVDGDKFVAVASGGAGKRVMYSFDGTTWTAPAGAVPVNNWKSVTWGGTAPYERFVAVAPGSDDSQVMISANGITWSPQSAISDDSWTSVTWGGPPANRFVAVASSGDDTRAMHSSDGVNWSWASGVPANDWQSVTWGNGLFVAVASGGDDSRVMTSTDGITWDDDTRTPVTDWQSVTWGNGKFVAVSSDTDDTQVMTSEDGRVWWWRAGSFYREPWSSVTWAGDMFVAVSSSGAGKQVMYSTDGVAWSTRADDTVVNQWQSVARGNFGEDKASDDTIVAVGAIGPRTNQVMTSVATPSPGEMKCIGVWNGSSWSPLGGVAGNGLDGGVTALAALGDDTVLVGGGGFEYAQPPATPYASLPGLVTWSGTGWTHPGVGGFQASVNSLLTDGSDTAYVGGQFEGEAPGDNGGIALMSGPYEDAASWLKMSTGFRWLNSGSPEPGKVDALASINGTVYAGGYFSATGDGSRPLRNLASWNGSTWNTVGPGLNGDDSSTTSVRALASDEARGLLYIGGTFDDTFGGTGNGVCDDTNVAVGPLRCVTAWDAGIDEYIPFQWDIYDDSNGLTGEVKAFVVKDSVVYVGGQFNTWPEGGFPKAWNLKNVGKWTWMPPTGSVSASASSGETVAITGTRFIGVPSDGVKFGSTVVPFTRSSTESITATVPNSLASGTYTISVNGVGGWADVGTVRVTRTSGGGGSSPSPSTTQTPTPTPSGSATSTPQPTASGPTAAQLAETRLLRPDRVPALSNGVPSGKAIVIVDGRPQKNTLTVRQQGMSVRTGPIAMTVRSQSARGVNQPPSDGSLSIPQSRVPIRGRAVGASKIQLTSSGNAPLTPMRVFLIPQPKTGPRGVKAVDLGYVMTDAQGRLQGKVSVRVRKAGDYILQINGFGSDGVVRSINLPAIVRAGPARN